jgi:hypothetical protein
VPGYQQISWAATGLLTDPATLLDFSKRGWIQTVEKNGSTFIAADQRYRARFILHLRDKKRLTNEQIEFVLSVQRPPYSAADVARLLKENGLGMPGAAAQPAVKGTERASVSGGR